MLGDTANPNSREYKLEEARMLAANKEKARRAALTPAQRAAEDKAKAEAAAIYGKAMAERNARVDVFNRTNTSTINLNMAKDWPTFHIVERLRELSLANDWLAFFTEIPYMRISNFTKFRFNWGPDGKPRFVPMTLDSWMNYFGHPERIKYVRNDLNYVCGENWIKDHSKDKYAHDKNRMKAYPNTDPRHVREWNPNDFKCKKPKKSTWVKLRKGVMIAVAVVAAVYLGPAALAAVQNGASAMTGGLIPAAGGGAGAAGAGAGAAAGAGAGSSAAAAATTGQRLLSGAKTLVGYVNKANTIKAIAKGELPPPPIGIGGATFGQWAMIVAKEEIKKEAMDRAMEAGTKYIEKKMTEKEEKEIKAEIEAMQRELLALTPKTVVKMPPEPDPELAASIKRIQQIEVKRADDLEKFIVPGAIIAGALLLGG